MLYNRVTSRRYRWLAGLVVLGVCLPAAGRAAVRTVDEKRPAPGDGTVEVQGISGEFHVTGGGGNEVRVHGTLDERIKLDFTTEGRRTIVHLKHPNSSRRFGSEADVKLTVEVPRGSDVEVRLVSADLEIAGVTGGVTAETVSGNIDLRDEPRRMRAQSVSGSVRIHGVSERIEAGTVSGSLEVLPHAARAKSMPAATDLSANSVSGSVRIDAGIYSDLEISSVSGSVVFRGDLAPRARCEVSSHSGSVEFELPGDASAEIEASSFSGSIESDFPGAVEGGSRRLSKALELTLGSGEATIELSSFSGSVRLLKR